jgi:hypothetical protein
MKTQMLTLSLPSNELFLLLIFPALTHFLLARRFVKHHHRALFNATNYLYRFLSLIFPALARFPLAHHSLSTVIVLFSMQLTISTGFSLAPSRFPHLSGPPNVSY